MATKGKCSMSFPALWSFFFIIVVLEFACVELKINMSYGWTIRWWNYTRRLFPVASIMQLRPTPHSFVHPCIISNWLCNVPNSNTSLLGFNMTVRLKEKYIFWSMMHGWEGCVSRHFWIFERVGPCLRKLWSKEIERVNSAPSERSFWEAGRQDLPRQSNTNTN